jgi:hypothetical protein
MTTLLSRPVLAHTLAPSTDELAHYTPPLAAGMCCGFSPHCQVVAEQPLLGYGSGDTLFLCNERTRQSGRDVLSAVPARAIERAPRLGGSATKNEKPVAEAGEVREHIGGDRPLLEAATLQRLMKTENFMSAVVTLCYCPTNLITNPKPFCCHSVTCQH